MTSYDVVIVGGGVIGSSIAYFLAASPDFDGRIAVVERDPTYETASTPRSAGGIRQQFSTPENIRMSQFAAQFVAEVEERLSVDGDTPALSFRQNGYLFLASEEGAAVLRENHAVQTAHGASVVLMSPAELEARFDWISTDGIVQGSLGLADEGWIDPYALLQGFRRKARSLGVAYIEDTVTGIDVEHGRAAGVALADGGRLGCGWAVNAAGPRAADIAAMIGAALPVRPRKRFVFVIDAKRRVPDFPLTIDPSGVWIRPEGEFYICGKSPEDHEDPDCLDLEIDHGWFEERVWPAIAARAPMFEAVKVVNAWAGHYAVNTFDANAVIGPHPEVGNFLFANGFSGHGLQQSPAVGRAVMEIVTAGGFRTLDLTAFGFDRFAANRPVIEKNVV